MKKVGPVLFLALLFGGAGLLAQNGKLSPIISRVLTREEVTVELITSYTECQHEEGVTAKYPQKKMG